MLWQTKYLAITEFSNSKCLKLVVRQIGYVWFGTWNDIFEDKNGKYVDKKKKMLHMAVKHEGSVLVGSDPIFSFSCFFLFILGPVSVFSMAFTSFTFAVNLAFIFVSASLLLTFTVFTSLFSLFLFLFSLRKFCFSYWQWPWLLYLFSLSLFKFILLCWS